MDTRMGARLGLAMMLAAGTAVAPAGAEARSSTTGFYDGHVADRGTGALSIASASLHEAKRAVDGTMTLAVGATAVAFGHWNAGVKQARTLDVRRHAVPLGHDPATLERGRYLYLSRGCADCHGANAGGHVFLDNGSLRIKGPNLTSGPGGLPKDYAAEHWERAIRHGATADQMALWRWLDAGAPTSGESGGAASPSDAKRKPKRRRARERQSLGD